MTNISNDQICKIFELAKLPIPNEITSDDFSKALIEIEKMLTITGSLSSKYTPEKAPKILVVDDLEISIYQLSLLLTKSGYNVVIARTIDEAIHEVKKQVFDYMFIDLFIPECEDGFKLLDFIKSKENRSKDYKAVIISGTDDKTLINQCFEHGTDEFIAKTLNWHKNILKFISQNENKKSKKNYTIKVEDNLKNIISILPLSFKNHETIIEVEKEISLQTSVGNNNIILDCENIANIDAKAISLLVSAYKLCSENNGKFVMCNTSDDINEALENVFLSNSIKTYIRKDKAVKALQES